MLVGDLRERTKTPPKPSGKNHTLHGVPDLSSIVRVKSPIAGKIESQSRCVEGIVSDGFRGWRLAAWASSPCTCMGRMPMLPCESRMPSEGVYCTRPGSARDPPDRRGLIPLRNLGLAPAAPEGKQRSKGDDDDARPYQADQRFRCQVDCQHSSGAAYRLMRIIDR